MIMSAEKASEEYLFRRKHEKIHLTKYIGKGGCVEIPQFIDGLPVTSVEWNTFYEADVSEVIIPDGVRRLGNMAFAYCKSLKKITLQGRIDDCYFAVFRESGLEEIEGIEYLSGSRVSSVCFAGTPFYDANETLIIGDRLVWCRDDSETIIVPENVKRIGYLAFYSSKAKKIILPDGLEQIENLAFYNAAVTEMHIPDSVVKAGGGIFGGCSQLKKIRLPQDFGRRKGWHSYLPILRSAGGTVMNDTQLYPPTSDDVLVYDNVSCITCENSFRYSPFQMRDKQIFPERLEYLKHVRLLASAAINVFRNDSFAAEREECVFRDMARMLSSRRFLIVFDLDDTYAEVLFFFPFVPHYSNHWYEAFSDMLEFYDKCLVNGKDGRFFDFERYDGHILEQNIPFRIKAEIACMRFKSGYRLSDDARKAYKQYFSYHRKKLNAILDKFGNEDMRRIFEADVINRE